MSIKDKRYAQHYRKEWEKDEKFEGWLTSVEGNNTRAFCKYCSTIINAKVYDLRKHMLTSKHIERVANRNQPKINEFVSKRSTAVEPSRIAEGALSLFVAEHTSLLTTDHLGELCKNVFKDSKAAKDIKLHRTKCSEIIRELIAPHFQSVILSDIGDQKYSVLLDESTDITVSKTLGMVIRYYSETIGNIVYTFLGLIELESGNAENIVRALVDYLREFGLDLKNLVGIGVDNASVMVGVNNGVYQLLKNKYGLKNLILVRCVCHSLQLAVSHASKNTIPRSIEFLISETYNWFAMSSSRQNHFSTIFATINCGKEPLKILKVCDTRWLSIEPAISRILEQWDELSLHFQLSREKENCYKADILHSMYKDPTNHLYLIYLKSVVSEVQVAVKLFEGDNIDPSKLLTCLTSLIKSLCGKILIPTMLHKIDLFSSAVKNHLDPSPYLGYSFESAIRKTIITPEEENIVRTRCKDFTLKLIEELQQRLPTHIETLEKIAVLNVHDVLKVVKGKEVIELAEVMGTDKEIIDKILTQWNNINFVKWQNVSNTILFWIEVSKYKDASDKNPFGELSALAISLLSLPHSNAEVERLFSLMNLVKSKLRNRMNLKTLNAIIRVRTSLKLLGKTCFNYELPEDVVRVIGTKQAYSFTHLDKSQPSTSNVDDPSDDDVEWDSDS